MGAVMLLLGETAHDVALQGSWKADQWEKFSRWKESSGGHLINSGQWRFLQQPLNLDEFHMTAACK